MPAGIVTINIKDAAGTNRAMQFWSDDGLVTGNLSPVPHDAATATKQTELAALVGEVTASPTANTLLDRLKVIATKLDTLGGYTDGLETLATSLNGYVDGLEGFVDGIETLQGTTNTTLTTLNGYVDGLESLATSLNGYVDGLETLNGAVTETAPASDTASSGLNGRLQRIAQRITSLIALLPTSLGAKAGTGSLSIVPATDASFVTTDVATGATATASAPDYLEGATGKQLSVDLNGGLRTIVIDPTTGAPLDPTLAVPITATQLPTTLGQKTGANSMSIVPASDALLAVTAPGASIVTVVPTVSTSAYSSGDCVGGLMTFDAVMRGSDITGLLQMVTIHCKTVQTGAMDLVIFNANPTASTFTDNAAFDVNDTDFDKIAAVVHITDWTNMTSNSFAQGVNLALPIKPVSGDDSVYAQLVTRATPTLSSTTDIKVTLKVLKD